MAIGRSGYKDRVARERRRDAALRLLKRGRGGESTPTGVRPGSLGAPAAAASATESARTAEAPPPPARKEDRDRTEGESSESSEPAEAKASATAADEGGIGHRISGLARDARDRIAAAGTAVAHRWGELPQIARQRIAAGAIVLGLVVLVVWILIPAAPCGAPGGDSCPAEDSAISLVPDDALAYAHVDIDPDSEELAAASDYGKRLPLLGGLLLGSISDIAGKAVDFRSQVGPWAGDEAAVAVLPQLPDSATVTMIEAEDVDAARDFATGLIGSTSTEDVGGLDFTVGRAGQVFAFVDGYLLIGDETGVRAMIEGDETSLRTAAAAAGLDDLPDERFAYAYLSGEGARTIFGRRSALSSLDTFVNSSASSAVTAAIGFEGGLASLTIRSEQDPSIPGAQPAFFSALPQFGPELDADVGPDALAYLGLGDPSSSVESLLDRAKSTAPALVQAYNRASADLEKAGDGVSITDDLLPLLGTEAALSIEPVAGETAVETPGVLAPQGVPYVSLIADGVDSKAAAEDLADLQKPLEEALVPKGGEAAGQVAVFEPLQIAGIEAQSLNVSPNVELTYATYDDRLVVATKPIGIAQARDGGDGLADSTDYRGVTSGMPGDVSALVYLDLRDLLALGEQVGLAADPAYARLAPDLRTLQAAAVSVDDTGDAVRTDINVSLGEPPEPASEDTALGGE